MSFAGWTASAQPLANRLVTVADCATVIAAWITVTIGNVARLRFLSPANIDAGSADPSTSPTLRSSTAVLQNTLEQGVLAVIVYAAAALMLSAPSAMLIAATMLFSIGRLLFWAGYRRGAEARALGFGLTFYPTVGIIMALLTDIVGRAV